MSTVSHHPDDTRVLGSRALLSVSVTAFLASITHAYDFGILALVVGAVVIFTLVVLARWYGHAGSRPALILYGLLNLWIIGGFGLVGGFWNHAVKLSLIALNGGMLPSGIESLFMSPDLGSPVYEAVSILTFGASMLTAFLGFRLVRTIRWRVS